MKVLVDVCLLALIAWVLYVSLRFTFAMLRVAEEAKPYRITTHMGREFVEQRRRALTPFDVIHGFLLGAMAGFLFGFGVRILF
jgi:hypothetical protein